MIVILLREVIDVSAISAWVSLSVLWETSKSCRPQNWSEITSTKSHFTYIEVKKWTPQPTKYNHDKIMTCIHCR